MPNHGTWPREVKLFEAYLEWADSDRASELREAGHSTDFATYSSALVTKRLMQVYRDTPSIWNRYSATYNVPDFKPISFVGLTEGEDLIEFVEGGEYKDSKIAERTGVSLSVKTYGRLFSISRKALINDDLGLLRDAPGRLGRASARTLAKHVVEFLEANGNAYDGTATFHSSHNNLVTDALSESGLSAAALKFNAQTDDNGNPITLIPSMLVVPPGLEITARRILNSVEITTQGSGSTPAYGQGTANVMQGYVPYAVERYFTDTNNWYLFADPNEAPVLAVGFLNGQRNPQVMMEDPSMRMTLGGTDPYSMEFDQMTYKVRHEWGVALTDWRGAVKAAVA
jgi:hypothetical protein